MRTLRSVSILIGLSAVAVSTQADAHEERLHGVATILAFEYMDRASSSTTAVGAAVGASQRSRFSRSYRTLQTLTDQASRQQPGESAELARKKRILFGIDPAFTGLSSTSTPSRGVGNLSGTIPGVPSEFPARAGALLGFLSAQTDRSTDVWTDARHPYQVVRERVEDGLFWAPLSTAATAFADGADAIFDSAGCQHALMLPFCILGAMVWGTMNAAIPGFLGGGFARVAGPGHIAEEVVVGCGANAFGQAAIEAMDLPPALATLIRNDTSFYADMGVTRNGSAQRACEAFEEDVSYLKNFRTYGRPLGLHPEASLILTTRARIADWYRAGGHLDPAATRGHFSAVEPWFLQPDRLSRIQLPNERADYPHRSRWQQESLTMVGHFLDVLTPADRHAVNFTGNNIRTMIPVAGGRHGKIHPYDGYALTDGVRLGSEADRLFDQLGVHGESENHSIRGAANDFRAMASPFMGYHTLRRRVCPAGTNGALQTRDGLGESNCGPDGARPNAAAGVDGKTLFERENPGADLGVLDGFSAFAKHDRPSQIGDYVYFDAFHPFMRAWRGIQYRPASTQTPYSCPNADCISDGSGAYAASYAAITREAMSVSSTRNVLRLRGLAQAIHLVQDMTVPHHLGSTSAHGHVPVEEFIANYVWPDADFTSGFRRANLRLTHGDPAHQVEPSRGSPAPSETPNPTAVTWRLDAATALTSPFAPAPQQDPNALFATILHSLDSVAGDASFWTKVRSEYAVLESYMDELARGTQCDRLADGRRIFASRRLTWATAYRTTQIMKEVYGALDGSTSDLTLAELGGKPFADAGFFLVSALSNDPTVKARQGALRINGVAAPDKTTHAYPGWVEFADRTVPLQVAATVHLLAAAADAEADPQTTCDGPAGVLNPEPAPATPAPAETPTERCLDEKGEETRTCITSPGSAMCTKYRGVSVSYDACTAWNDTSGRCNEVADALATCMCSGGDSTTPVSTCVEMTLRRTRLRELLQAGRIDRATYDHQLAGGNLYVDTDRDGIPDISDACDCEARTAAGACIANASARVPGTTLATNVCMLDGYTGNCGFGCTAPTP